MTERNFSVLFSHESSWVSQVVGAWFDSIKPEEVPVYTVGPLPGQSPSDTRTYRLSTKWEPKDIPHAVWYNWFGGVILHAILGLTVGVVTIAFECLYWTWYETGTDRMERMRRVIIPGFGDMNLDKMERIKITTLGYAPGTNKRYFSECRSDESGFFVTDAGEEEWYRQNEPLMREIIGHSHRRAFRYLPPRYGPVLRPKNAWRLLTLFVLGLSLVSYWLFFAGLCVYAALVYYDSC